jgi:hypothetical protein
MKKKEEKKEPEAAKHPGGRPTDYTPELADEICMQIATQEKGLHAICRNNENFPHPATVLRWLGEHEEFRDKYQYAREMQSDLMAESILDIADHTKDDTLYDDDGNPYENKEWVNRSKLRVDARKWFASKLAPKKYGDKVDVTSGGEKIKAPVIVVQSEQAKKDLEDL